MAILNPIVPRRRKSPITAAFHDAVDLSAVAPMRVVAVEPGLATLAA